MSLWGKIMAQHNKSVEQMRQAKEEMRKAKEDFRKGWNEVKQAGKEYFKNEVKPQIQAEFQALKEESKQQFKRAADEFKTGMRKAKEILLTRCPKCNSSRTKKQRPYNLFLFLLSLFFMTFGTLLFGVLGLILGSLLMIVPGWQSLKSVVSPTYRCKECGHTFRP